MTCVDVYCGSTVLIVRGDEDDLNDAIVDINQNGLNLTSFDVLYIRETPANEDSDNTMMIVIIILLCLRNLPFCSRSA